MKQLLLLPGLLLTMHLTAQKADTAGCTIIDMAKEAGTFTIRDIKTGRIVSFKPDALDGAELKVGDSVDAMFDSKKVIAVKGIARAYDITNAMSADSCCIILKLDSIVSEPSWKITAKNNATGENIYFNVPKSLATRLSAGGIVYTQPSHGYAMIAAAQSDTTERQLYGFPLLQENIK